MNAGKGWLIIENSIHNGTEFLVSIINSRRSGTYVQEYMEQIYVDRFASIEEKIEYKKNPNSWPYRARPQGVYSGIIDCGHDPIMTAYKCHKLILENDIITYTYKTMKGQRSDLSPIFKEIEDSIKLK